jgi:hypothetical protein
MDLLDKIRMRLWLENHRLYGSGGNGGDPISHYTLSDIPRIRMKGDVIPPEHYKRKIVKNNTERKKAFRELLEKHGVEIPSSIDPDLFTYFLSVIRARAPYTLEGSQKVLRKRKAAAAKRATKKRQEKNRGNANEEEEENEEDENEIEEGAPAARAAPLTQRRNKRAAQPTRSYYFRQRKN